MPRTLCKMESFDGSYGCSLDGISRMAGTAILNLLTVGRILSAIFTNITHAREQNIEVRVPELCESQCHNPALLRMLIRKGRV